VRLLLSECRIGLRIIAQHSARQRQSATVFGSHMDKVPSSGDGLTDPGVCSSLLFLLFFAAKHQRTK
jgi:hypothetical protein